MEKIAKLKGELQALLVEMKALSDKEESAFTADDQKRFDEIKDSVASKKAAIERVKTAQAGLAETAQPAIEEGVRTKAAAVVENDAYVKDRSLLLGGLTKSLAMVGGNVYEARAYARESYGENHPVTKSLVTSSAGAGGLLVPPDVMNEVIPLLRAAAVVRSAGPRTLPMPRGTMRLPSQASAATASYGKEGNKIAVSQQSVGAVVASFKKLTALVPVSNDMMRYADPAIDAFVRDDMIRIMALKEDLAFLTSDGTQDSPRGYLSFANGWVGANGGTIGVWSTSAASTFAVNAADPANSTGGNFITSTESYTLATVAAELGGAVNRLDTANVPDNKRVWFMHPRSYNYLFNVQNSLGVYVYRDELIRGTLLGYPFRKTTQIGTNYQSGSNTDCSFVFLVEMTEDIILDSMQLELAVSREGAYIDSNGVQQNAFANDETLIRAIAEHDHQMRHDAAIAVIQRVRWAPAIS
jgi:HK97 family phage major capsid protein